MGFKSFDDVGSRFTSLIAEVFKNKDEPVVLRLKARSYHLSSGHDDPDCPDDWTFNRQVLGDWTVPRPLRGVNKHAARSLEAIRRRLAYAAPEDRLDLVRDVLAADSATAEVKCELIRYISDGIDVWDGIIARTLMEPYVMFVSFARCNSPDANPLDRIWTDHMSTLSEQKEEALDAAESEHWERWSGISEFDPDFDDSFIELDSELFDDEDGRRTMWLLYERLTDQEEDVYVRRLCALVMEELVTRRGYRVDIPVFSIAHDLCEPWQLRCTCARLMLQGDQYRSTWEDAEKNAASILADVVMKPVIDNEDDRIFQRFAAATFRDSEEETARLWEWIADQIAPGLLEKPDPLGSNPKWVGLKVSQLLSLTEIAEREFGDKFRTALAGIDADIEQLKSADVWPQLADDADAIEEMRWREYALNVFGNNDHSEEDLKSLTQTLAEVGDAECRELLTTKLIDPCTSGRVRGNCALALGRIFDEHGDQMACDVLKRCFHCCDTPDELRAVCLYEINPVKDKADQKWALSILHNFDEPECVRITSMVTLSGWDDYKAVREVCLPILESNDQPVELRMAASRVMAAWANEDDLEVQLAILDDAKYSEILRSCCARNLVPFYAVHPLLDRVKKSTLPESVRVACAEALNCWLSLDTNREQIQPVFEGMIADARTPSRLLSECERHVDVVPF
jgi:hypothetical protein